MANFIYNRSKQRLGTATLNLGTDDLRALLVMTNTTSHTEDDAQTMGTGGNGTTTGFTTLDDYDGANYTAGGIAIANDTNNEDSANNRFEYDGDDVTWTNLGAGTRQAKALIVYKFITNLAASLPIAYIDQGGFPFTGNGSSVTIQWNVEGILQVA